MKKGIPAEIITYFFILLFLYTGIAKLMEIHTVNNQLTYSPLLGSMSGIVGWVLPIGEILLAIALFIPAWRLRAMYCTGILMTLFTAYVIIILSIDDHLSCSCGGIIEELSPRQHVLFNAACVILSILAILILRRSQPTLRFTWLTGTSTIGLFLIVGWTLFTAFTSPMVIKTGMEGSPLPAFHLQLVDSVTQFNTANIPAGQPIIMIGFSPWCIHCQQETRDIIRHIQQFKNIRIYYVTDFPFKDMKTFYRYFKLDRYPNIVMGRDDKHYFLSYFKAHTVPYTVIFDAKERLQEIIHVEARADILLKAAND